MRSRPSLLAAAVIGATLAVAAAAAADPFIYYGGNNGVWRANIDGTSPTNIVVGQFAGSLAVDADHIYFKSIADPHAITRTDIDGTNLDSAFITLRSNAHSIKEIEANATHLFWTDDNNNSIGRARIAGTCSIVFESPPCDVNFDWIPAGATGTGDGGISGLAVNATHIYWTRVVAGTIARADLDGGNRNKDLITGINTVGLDQAPFDVDVNATHIYWTDAPDKMIGRAQLNGSSPPTNLERTYVDAGLNSITAVEANGTHVLWASDGGTIGRARTAGTCTIAPAPPCDIEPNFIGGGNQLRSLELGVVPQDMVVTDCDAPELATVTEITGDLIVQNVVGCDSISLPNLTEIGGIVIEGNTSATTIDIGSLTSATGSISIDGNTNATTIDLGALTSSIGGISISGNTAADTVDLGSLTSATGSISIDGNTNATTIDLGSLASAIGSIDITGNASGTVVDLGAITSISGDLDLDTAGTTVDLSDASVIGHIDITANGSNTVTAVTAGGETDIEVLGGTASMHVVLPDGAFDQPVPFTIERQSNGAPEPGTTAAGAAATIDPVAGYRFTFNLPTLGQLAQLTFTVDLAQIDAATRAALLAGVADQTATLALRADSLGSLYQGISRCTGSQTPAADGCVNVLLLGPDGQPAAPGVEPAFVRFDGVASHFSTYAVALVAPAGAVDFTVNDKEDAPDAAIDGVCATAAGVCSLRAAIQEANATAGTDTINLPANKYTLKIVGAGEDAAATGDLDISDDLAIVGAGAKATVIKGKKDRVFHVQSGTVVTMSDLTISKGAVGKKDDLGSEFGGGGIRSEGTLTLTDCVVTSNKTSDDGGGIASDFETLTLVNSVVSKNEAGDDAGGIDSDGGTVVLTDSTIEKNKAGDEGGGMEAEDGDATATGTTISNNTAKNNAGGINLEQGGTFEGTNVTFSGNKAKTTGGAINVEDSVSSVELVSATLANNKAKEGGGIFNNGGTVEVSSALFHKNKKTTCAGTITSGGGNVEDSDDCGLGSSDLGGAGKLKIKGLESNGGPTKTHALVAGNPAIDAGNDVDCPTGDQRGVARLDVAGVGTAVCDSGSYEFVPEP